MSHAELVDLSRTPARKDKHIGVMLLFVAIVVANHRAGLGLTMGELAVLGVWMGAYIGQSQVAALMRLKELLVPRPPTT